MSFYLVDTVTAYKMRMEEFMPYYQKAYMEFGKLTQVEQELYRHEFEQQRKLYDHWHRIKRMLEND